MDFVRFAIVATILLGCSAACASDAPVVNTPSSFRQITPGDIQILTSDSDQVVAKGNNIQSLLDDLAAMGVDPNSLSRTLPDGTYTSPFASDVTGITWQRTVPKSQLNAHGGATGFLGPTGSGNPGDTTSTTTVYTHNGVTTVIVCNYVWAQRADGTWGWQLTSSQVFTYRTQPQ